MGMGYNPAGQLLAMEEAAIIGGAIGGVGGAIIGAEMAEMSMMNRGGGFGY